MPRLLHLALTGLLIGGPVLLAQKAKPPIPTDAAGRWKWEQMDQGPFFASNLKGKVAALKTLTLRVGSDTAPAAVSFDTMTLRWNAAWSGGFLHLPKGRDGMEGLPEPWGEVLFSTSNGPGWATADNLEDPRPTRFERLPDAWGHWRGLYRHGQRVVLQYDLGKVGVLEQPSYEGGGFNRVVQYTTDSGPRMLRIAEIPERNLAVGPNSATFKPGTNGTSVEVRLDGVAGTSEFRLVGSTLWLSLPAIKAHQPFRLTYLPEGSPLTKRTAPADLRADLKPGPKIWGNPVVTQGKLTTSGGWHTCPARCLCR
jgi:hypothetical protein